MDFDEILPDIGEFGKYQKLMLGLVLLPCLTPGPFHAYVQIFLASTPPHRCRVPPIPGLANVTHDHRMRLVYPVTSNASGSPQYSSCRMYDPEHVAALWPKNASSLPYSANPLWPTKPCIYFGWEYDKEQHATTVVTQWDIVCDKDWYPVIALCLFGVGGLVGNYIFGYLQDGIGRRPSFFLFLGIECFFSLASVFSPSFVVWLILRVGVGFTVPAIMGTPFVLAVELVGKSKRTITTIFINIWYSLSLVLLAGVVWLVREWTILTLVTALPFVFLFGYWRILPESPRWLLAHNRFEEAETVVRYIARVNGKSLPPDYMVNLKRRFQVESAVREGEQRQRNMYGVKDLFRTPNMARKTLVITFIWFTNTSVYVGLSYYAPALGGDEYLNFFLAGVAELPTYLFLMPSMEYWGRRWTLCISMGIGGVACICTIFVQNNATVTLVLYCVGKFGISSSFVALPLIAIELYPTVVRGIGLGFSSMAGMAGPIVIPFVNYLGEDFLALPLVIMGSLLTVGSIFALLLPETLWQPLPQTLEDGEEFGKGYSLREWFECCPVRPSAVEEVANPNDEDTVESPLRSLLECQETLSLQNELMSERNSLTDKDPEDVIHVTVL